MKLAGPQPKHGPVLGEDGQPVAKETAQQRLERLQAKPPVDGSRRGVTDSGYPQRKLAWETAVYKAKRAVEEERAQEAEEAQKGSTEGGQEP